MTVLPRRSIGTRSREPEVILTNKVIINADHMTALPELKYIGVLATGYNVVDTAVAKERGIIVTNIPAYSTGFPLHKWYLRTFLISVSRYSIIRKKSTKVVGPITRISVFGILR